MWGCSLDPEHLLERCLAFVSKEWSCWFVGLTNYQFIIARVTKFDIFYHALFSFRLWTNCPVEWMHSHAHLETVQKNEMAKGKVCCDFCHAGCSMGSRARNFAIGWIKISRDWANQGFIGATPAGKTPRSDLPQGDWRTQSWAENLKFFGSSDASDKILDRWRWFKNWDNRDDYGEMIKLYRLIGKGLLFGANLCLVIVLGTSAE